MKRYEIRERITDKVAELVEKETERRLYNGFMNRDEARDIVKVCGGKEVLKISHGPDHPKYRRRHKVDHFPGHPGVRNKKGKIKDV